MITASWVQPLADVLAEHPVLGRLCFASVEFAALALAAAGLLALLRRRSPRLAALLWLVVMAKPLVGLVVGAPLPLFGLTLPAPPPQPVFVAPQPELPEPPQPAATMIVMHAPVAPAPPAAPPIDWAAQAPRLILGAWLAGVGAFALRLLLSAVRLARLTRRAAAPPAWVAERLAALGQEMDRMEHGSPGGHDEGNTERGRQGCRRNFNLPRCLITTQLESPALAGFWRPVILLPAWVCAEGDPVRIEWSLRHELMHWRLRDPLASLVCELVKILFFFHPAAWWAGRRWQEATELACDRALIRSVEEAEAYVQELYRMLLKVRDRRRLPLAGGLFAGRTQISRRIASLVQDPLRSPARLSAAAMAFVVAFSLATLALGLGIKKEKPAEQPPAPSAAAVPAEPDPLADAIQPPAQPLLEHIEKFTANSITMDHSIANSLNLEPNGQATLQGKVRFAIKIGSSRIVILADRAEYNAQDNQNGVLHLHRDAPDASMEKLAAQAGEEFKEYPPGSTLWVSCDLFRIERLKETQQERVVIEGDIAVVENSNGKPVMAVNGSRAWLELRDGKLSIQRFRGRMNFVHPDQPGFAEKLHNYREEARLTPPPRPLPVYKEDVAAERAKVTPADRAAVKDLMARAGQAARKGRMQEAADLLRQALKKDPANATAWVQLGVALTMTKQLTNDPEVWEVYTRALACDPNNVQALCGVGGLYRTEKQPAEAAKYFERALQIDPQNLIVLANWVLMDTDNYNLERARQRLARMKAIDPNNLYTRRMVRMVARAEAEERGLELPFLLFDDLTLESRTGADQKPHQLVLDPEDKFIAWGRNISRDPATGAFIIKGEAGVSRKDKQNDPWQAKADTIRIERDADGKSVRVDLIQDPGNPKAPEITPPDPGKAHRINPTPTPNLFNVVAPAKAGAVTSVTQSMMADLSIERMTALSIDLATSAGTAQLRGKARIECKDFDLSAEEIEIDPASKELRAPDALLVLHGTEKNSLQCGRLTYSLKTHRMHLEGVTLTQERGGHRDVIHADTLDGLLGDIRKTKPQPTFPDPGLTSGTFPFKRMFALAIEIDPQGLTVLTGKVQVESEDFSIACDQLKLDNKTKILTATGGRVKCTQGTSVQGECRNLTYNLKTKSSVLDGEASIFQTNPSGQQVQAMCDTIKIDYPPAKPGEKPEDVQPRVSFIQKGKTPPQIKVLNRGKPMPAGKTSGTLSQIPAIAMPLPPRLAETDVNPPDTGKWETVSPGAVMSPRGLITDPVITALGASGEPLGGLGKTYLAILVNRVEEEFMPSATSPDAHCTVGFTVAKDGSVSQARVEQSSGDARFDAQALQALEATKLPPLYDGMKTESAAVRLTFNAHPLPSGPPRPEEVKFEDITITPPDPAHPEAGYRLSDRAGRYQGRAGKITADAKARTITLTNGVELIHDTGGVKIQDKADKLEMVFDAKLGIIQIKGKTETKILNPELPPIMIMGNPGGNGLISDLSILTEPPTGQAQLDQIQVNRISVYLYEAVKALEDRFEPPLEEPRARCMVGFTILKDGKISEPRIIMASTNPKFNAEVHHVLEVVKLPPLTETLPAFMEMRPPLKGGLGLETLPVVLTFNARPAPIAEFSQPAEPGAPKTPEKKESPEELLKRAAEFYDISLRYYQEWLRTDRQRPQIETRSEGAFALQYLNLAVRGYSEALKANPKLDGAARKKMDEHLLNARTMRLKLEDANQAGKTP